MVVRNQPLTSRGDISYYCHCTSKNLNNNNTREKKSDLDFEKNMHSFKLVDLYFS